MNVSKCFWQCAKRKQHTKDSKLNVICQVLSVYVCVHMYVCCGPVFVCVHVAFFVLFHFQLLFVFAMARKLISWLAVASRPVRPHPRILGHILMRSLALACV